ncbi:MAG TPA: FKBP-type peptidyl-prolyl cis-trans isomerase [Steroidobacteraceae bacterium]|nr:FKBP-type peptidyl-prolyl cis-trans isomerase [Steroidobacteraceae bacterium]
MRNGKKELLGIALLLLSTAGVAAPAAAAPAALGGTAPTTASRPDAARMSSDEAATYSLGLTFGGQLHHSGLKDNLSTDALLQGIRDGLRGKTVSPEDKLRVAALLRSTKEAAGAKNYAAAREFLARNAKSEGVTTLPSGLQYKVLAPGNADLASPKPADQVTVQYRGRLLNGTEFDSSFSHGQAASFRLDSVIKGWQEALSLMKPGAKWQLFVPPQLAYDVNTPAAIPPGSLLVFDLELVKIDSAAGPGTRAGGLHTKPPKS